MISAGREEVGEGCLGNWELGGMGVGMGERGEFSLSIAIVLIIDFIEEGRRRSGEGEGEGRRGGSFSLSPAVTIVFDESIFAGTEHRRCLVSQRSK